MGQGFLKFKRRMMRACIWRSVLPGVSLALAIFAVLMTLYKRDIVSITPMLGACIGAGAGLFLTAALFALLYPYRKRLARKLDGELELHEGVQTMLAFSERQDGMMQLQREQTDARLQSIPTKKLKIRHAWTCVVSLVLATLMTVTAFAIPAKQPEPPPVPEDPPFDLGEWEEIALQDLIEEVRASDMTEPARSDTVIALEGLLSALRNTQTHSRMRALVIETVISLRDVVDGVVTLRSFAPIFGASGSAYTRAFGEALGMQDQDALEQALGAVAAGICEEEDFDAAVHVLSEELRMALRTAGVHREDALYAEIERLANTLTGIVDDADRFPLNVRKERVGTAFSNACTLTGPVLTRQSYDADMGAYVESRLLEIFGLSESDLPAGEQEEHQGPQDPGDYDDDKQNGPLTDGGLGSGELILGSQDIIYDPFSGEYMKYSEVIDRYNAMFLEKKIDGLLSDEAAALIEAYFTALFSPSNQD